MNKILTLCILGILSITMLYGIDKNYSLDLKFYQNAYALDDTMDSISFGELNTGTVAVNQQTNLVYVTNFRNGTVSVIDGDSNDMIDFFKAGKTPFGLGINEKTNMIYVGAEYNNTLYVINGFTNTIEDSIEIKEPYDIAVDPNTNMVYVTSDGSKSVYAINGNTNKIVKTFEVSDPCGIAVNTETDMIYVTSESTNKVHVIDSKKNEIVGIIDVSESPRGVIANPTTNMIYVTNQKANTVSIIDGSTNSVIGSIPVNSPFEMAINSDSNKIYTTFYGTGELTVIQGYVPGKQEITLSDNLPPIKQMKLGISSKEVTCDAEKELMFKNSNGAATCVKSETVEKLTARNWGHR